VSSAPRISRYSFEDLRRNQGAGSLNAVTRCGGASSPSLQPESESLRRGQLRQQLRHDQVEATFVEMPLANDLLAPFAFGPSSLFADASAFRANVSGRTRGRSGAIPRSARVADGVERLPVKRPVEVLLIAPGEEPFIRIG